MNNTIRILLIPSSDYLGHPFPQRHNHIFERLHKKPEFEVHVIRFNIFGRSRLQTECVVHEIPLEITTRSTALYYLANIANHVSEILRIIKQESIDIVVAGNLLPPLTYMLFRHLTNRRIPFIFDLQDYYPTSATGYIVDVNSTIGIILRGVFEWITQQLIQKANAVVVPGIALALYAKKLRRRDVYIVPNGISEHFLVKHDGTIVRKKLELSEQDIVVGYIGSIEFWLDMRPLLEAIMKAYSNRIPVKLLLIGKNLQTNYAKKVESMIREYGLEELAIWLDFVPYEEVPKYMAAIDIGVIPFNPVNPTAYFAAPNKLWEYLSQGVMVVSTRIPESIYVSKILERRGIKNIYLVRSSDDYLKVIANYRKTVSNNSLQDLLKARIWDKLAYKYGKLIKSLVKQQSREI